MKTERNDIRVITNDLYAPNACVMDEAGFDAMCNELGWTDCKFADAGPVVRSEDEIREMFSSENVQCECIEQFRQIVGQSQPGDRR